MKSYHPFIIFIQFRRYGTQQHIVYFSQTFSSLGHQCRYKYTFLLLWVNNRTLEHSIIHSVGKNYKKLVFVFFFSSIENTWCGREKERDVHMSNIEFYLRKLFFFLLIIMTLFVHITIHDFISKKISKICKCRARLYG